MFFLTGMSGVTDGFREACTRKGAARPKLGGHEFTHTQWIDWVVSNGAWPFILGYTEVRAHILEQEGPNPSLSFHDHPTG